jgi:dethiobiotin synthetase
MVKAYFVTGTGTGVGKTYLTCALIRHWRRQDLAVGAFKPVISGFSADDLQTDTHRILDALGEQPTPGAIAAMSPWRFAAPLSPDIAAAREGQAIAFDEVLTLCREALDLSHHRLLIEGVGGAFVPLNPKHLVADWIKALDIPALVVAGSYLGTISHTLATMEALAARGVKVAALLVSESPEAPMPLAETVAALAHFLKPLPVIALPRREAFLPDLPEFAMLDEILE